MRIGREPDVLSLADNPSEWPPIELTLRQSIAAFWSISWPAAMLSLVLMSLLPSQMIIGMAEGATAMRFLMFNAISCIFIVAQFVLVGRLTKKAYRLFRIAIVRDDGSLSRNLDMSEWAGLWARIAWPQALCLIATYFLKVPLGLYLFIDCAIVGPIALRFAINLKSPKLNLQAFGIRYI